MSVNKTSIVLVIYGIVYWGLLFCFVMYGVKL